MNGDKAPDPEERTNDMARKIPKGAARPHPRLQVERQGGRVVVTLDHPARLNVLNQTAWDALGALFGALADDDGIRAVVLRGAGGRAFSAGSDIGGFGKTRSTPEQVESYAASLEAGIHGVWRCPHPTVAAVEGICVGGGMILAACCDLVVAGEGSRFGAPINRLGVTMAYEEMAPLVAAVGARATLEVLLTGDLVGAGRAREMGLVSRVVPAGEAERAADEVAQAIAAGAPQVNRWHKTFVHRLTLPAPLTPDERAEPYEAFRSPDYREGTAAFLEKRAPNFQRDR